MLKHLALVLALFLLSGCEKSNDSQQMSVTDAKPTPVPAAKIAEPTPAPAPAPAPAPTISLVCNYEQVALQIGQSFPTEKSPTFDLDAKTVSGWSHWGDESATIRAEIDEGSLTIQDVRTDGSTATFRISRIDGTVTGGVDRGDHVIYRGSCAKTAERKF